MSVDERGGGEEGGGDSHGRGDSQGTLYSDRLKTNVRYNQLLKRNVLDITLNKDESTNNNYIEPDDIGKLLIKLGINIQSQVYPGRPFHLEVWMNPGIDLNRFCKDDIIQVNNNVKTSFIRPAGRREVTVSIKGLLTNTPDSHVIDYLNKHGVVANNSVIYEKDTEGLMKGKMNGIRKYLVDFTKGNRLNMGSFHIINGNRVTVRYPGQKKTCARCHKTASQCLGGGLASKCEEEGGVRVKLSEVMRAH